jgi:hypothetical protein
MFLKRKTSRPTRERLLADDDEENEPSSSASGPPKTPSKHSGERDEGDGPDPHDSPAAALAARLKAKKKGPFNQRSRLSFGGDDAAGSDAGGASPAAKKSLRASLVLKDGMVLNACVCLRNPLRVTHFILPKGLGRRI